MVLVHARINLYNEGPCCWKINGKTLIDYKKGPCLISNRIHNTYDYWGFELFIYSKWAFTKQAVFPSIAIAYLSISVYFGWGDARRDLTGYYWFTIKYAIHFFNIVIDIIRTVSAFVQYASC